MLKKLLRPRGEEKRQYAAPDGARLYAVGDIHGREDLLLRLNDMIVADSLENPAERNVLIYLGDYIDRGESSRQVIDFLMGQQIEGFEIVHLTGNHEEMMMIFLDDPSIGLNWVANGGGETLMSYGVGHPGHRALVETETAETLQAELREAVPADHWEFLKSLATQHVEGEYMFVHAGIMPGTALDEQNRKDLLWIRDEFLGSDADFGKCIVHGHTIAREVAFKSNRIGIDTGAFFTGVLTCLVLEGQTQRLLQT